MMEPRIKPTFYRAIDLYSSDSDEEDTKEVLLRKRAEKRNANSSLGENKIVKILKKDKDNEYGVQNRNHSPSRRSGRKIRLPARIEDDLTGEIIDDQNIFNSCFEASSVEIDDEEDNGEGIKRLDEDEDIDVNSDTDNNSQISHNKDRKRVGIKLKMKHKKNRKLPLVQFISGIISKKKHKSAIANHMFRNRIQKKKLIKESATIKSKPKTKLSNFTFSCKCASTPSIESEESTCRAQIYIRNTDGNMKVRSLKLKSCSRKSKEAKVHSASASCPDIPLCEAHYNNIRQHEACPICGHICNSGKFFICIARLPERHYYCLDHDCYNSSGQLTCPHCNSTTQQKHIYAYSQGEQRSFKCMEIKNGTSFKKPRSDKSANNNAIQLPHIKQRTYKLTAYANKSNNDCTDIFTLKEMNKLTDILLKPRIISKVRTLKAFYTACSNGDITRILSLINHVNLNMSLPEFNNQSPLHAVAINGDIFCMEILLNHNACYESVNDDLETPLMLAIKHCHTRAAIFLMSYSDQADLTRDKDGLTPFHFACRFGNIDVATYLLAHYSFDINTQDFGGYTALVWATESSHLHMVLFLLANSANPMILDDDLNSGLHWAAYCGSLSILQIFIEICILNDVNLAGDTPLHIAIRQNNFEAVEFLINKGADISYKNNEKLTPLQICLSPDSEIANFIKMKEIEQIKNNTLQIKKKYLSSDISNTKEPVPIPCVNEIDECQLPTNYSYITTNAETRHMGIQRSIISLKSCQCKGSGCYKCFCSVKDTYTEHCYYTKRGQLIDNFDYLDPPHIFECNHLCLCRNDCLNRVVQKGGKCRLEMFRTVNTGWGIRTLMNIEKGTFVGQYLGEFVKDSDADERSDDQYLFGLGINGDEQFCLDAKKYSNYSRFINHSCAPNLISVNVFTDHHDERFPQICFFSNQFISANTELSIDYGERFWMIKGKNFLCKCETQNCRYNSLKIKATIERFSALNFHN